MRICIIILFLGCSLKSFGQDANELELLKLHVINQPVTSDTPPDRDAYYGVIGRLFFFYKSYISTQDHMSCVFVPSCSEYAHAVIRKQGFFIGLLNTFDRLTRCNGMRPGDYIYDPRTRKLRDPARNIRYELL